MIEAHFVNQLLENQGIVGEEVYAPLPVVEADGAGDDLFYFTSIAAPDETVFIHLALALFHRKRVPVLVFATSAIHGIKTEVTVGRHQREQARLHCLFLTSDGLRDRFFPFVRV